MMTGTSKTTFKIHGQRRIILPPFKPREGLCPVLPGKFAGPGMVNLQVLFFLANVHKGQIPETASLLTGYKEGQEVPVEEIGGKLLQIAAGSNDNQIFFQNAADALFGLTGVEGVIALLSAPGISRENRGSVAESTFGVLENPDMASQSPLRHLSADELNLLGQALIRESLQPYHAGFKLALSLNVGRASQIKLQYRNMVMNNPRWRVYLSLDDICHVGRMLNYPSDDTIFNAATQQNVTRIYHTVTQKRLGLFTHKAFSENAKGFALKRVITKVLTGRWASFGTTTQQRVAKGFAVKDELSSVEKDARVLRGIRYRQSFFDPKTGQLPIELRQRILAVNTKYPEDLLAAVEELEYLLREVD